VLLKNPDLGPAGFLPLIYSKYVINDKNQTRLTYNNVI